MHGIRETQNFLTGYGIWPLLGKQDSPKSWHRVWCWERKRYDDRRSGCGAGLRDHYQTYLGAGRLGREMKGTPSFLLLRFLAVFLWFFSIPRESKGLEQSSHWRTQCDDSWPTSFCFLNFVFQCKFMHVCCCFTESLQDFKSEVHKLFPLIYDTKFLAFEIRKNPVSKLAEEQYFVWEYWQVRERGQKPQRIEESGGLPLLSSLPQRLLPDVASKSSKRADIRKRF